MNTYSQDTHPFTASLLNERGLKGTPQNPPLQHEVPPSPNSNQSLSSSDEETKQLNHGLVSAGASIMEIDENKGDEPPDFSTFHSQHISDIATQLSMVLADIIDRNDQTPFSANKLTRFHSRAPPGISIKDYLARIIKFCNLEKAVLLVILYLVDLFTDSYEKFVLNSLTVHRFLITGCTVASKGLCDQFCSNTHYAKVGGLSVMELNLLEVEFLTRVKYRIVPPMATLGKYDRLLQSKVIPVEFLTPSSTDDQAESRKHPREDQPKRDVPEVTNVPKPPGKPTGNKGFKAMKETFKFLQSTKKK